MSRPAQGGQDLVLGGASLLTALCTVGPWARSGSRIRDSYELADVAERAGVIPSGLDPLATAWFLVPALCGATLLAIAVGRPRMAAGAAGTLGVLVALGGVLVCRSPLAVQPAAIGGIAMGLTTVLVAIRSSRTPASEDSP